MTASRLSRVWEISLSIVLLAVVSNVQAEYQSTLTWSSPAELQSDNILSYWILEKSSKYPFGSQYIEIIPKTADGEINGYSYNVATDTFTCFKINVWTIDYQLLHANSEVCINPPINPPAFCETF